ncbi:hypothetical protein [Janibacter cremeus]|uniref:Uncharacterized protein YybS (DUF2232 family) n=1 Tax=Janibacter cremeus TaxID=1285192 RepID=A0A852VX75_9MICO|nr:hypothetical protein [Janibacter cremeus]NYF98131.1 uncharacterized protein YybS (DUF2232 family) [Janibacter cremeus]
MSIFAAVAVLAVLLVAGLSPWWVAGRYLTPVSERVALNELGLPGIVATLRRGANMYVPATIQTRN